MTIENALSSDFVVISVVGPHANEDIDSIFLRKKRDIDIVGKTFWLCRSYKSRPVSVQSICRSATRYAIFISACTKSAAKPTLTDKKANEFSADREMWNIFPSNISPITGKIDRGAYAFVFDMLQIVDQTTEIDMWGYMDFYNAGKPVKFNQRCSTAVVVKGQNDTMSDGMKSRYRSIVAIGRFVDPYCVWLR